MTEMTSHSEDGVVDVTDLTMATYLIMRRCDATLIRSGETQDGHPIGVWRFQNSGAVQALMGEYAKRKARVEPKAFHSAINTTRRELFEFLGIGQRGGGQSA